MTSSKRGEFTRVLSDVAGLGRAEAMDRLFPIVYDELRALARGRLANEQRGHTLQATALVHEAYLRLVDPDASAWSNRAHFFHAAAEAMRRILIDHARRRGRIKRGGGRIAVDLEDAQPARETDLDQLLAVDEAIRRLEKQDERAAAVVRLRYFAGLSVAEVANAMELSERTVMREWAYAKAWLHEALGPPDG